MNLSRRTLIQALGAGAMLPIAASLARAQAEPQLPLRTTGIEHIGLTVPDTERSARFYGPIFNPEIHREKEPPPRFYVTTGVGYIAVGGTAGAGPHVDHFCALVEGYRPQEMRKSLEAAGLTPGRFGMIDDPDGLRLQLLGTPGGLAASTEPAGRIADEPAAVQPIGLDHVVLLVSGLERSVAHYRHFFGAESPRTAGSTRVWFRVANTRLGLEAAAGREPRVDHFCINVARFDRGAVTDRLAALGGTVVPADDEEGVLRFRDPDGILVELKQA